MTILVQCSLMSLLFGTVRYTVLLVEGVRETFLYNSSSIYWDSLQTSYYSIRHYSYIYQCIVKSINELQNRFEYSCTTHH